jgi:hypothetical protein
VPDGRIDSRKALDDRICMPHDALRELDEGGQLAAVGAS